MKNFAKDLINKLGSSIGTAGLFSLLLYLAVFSLNSESMSEVETWFSRSDSNLQFVRVNFVEPQFHEQRLANGNLCTQINMPQMRLSTTGGAPRLPLRPLNLNKPTEAIFQEFKEFQRQSHKLKLNHPLCRAPYYKQTEKFSDDALDDSELELTNEIILNGKNIFPYPQAAFSLKSLPQKISDDAALHFLIYPVVAINEMNVEIFSQLTITVRYSEEQRQLGFKQFTPQFAFALPTQASLRITVDHHGAYEVNGAILENIPAGTDLNSIQIWRHNQQLPREIVSSSGNLQAIRFIVPPFEKTYFHDQAALWVRWGEGTGINFSTVDADPTLLPMQTSIYRQKEHIQQTTRGWNSLPFTEGISAEGDPIPPPPDRGYAYWKLQYVPGPFSSINYAFTPKAPLVPNSVVKLQPQLRGLSYYNLPIDHHVTFALNGTAVGDISFDDQQLVIPEYSLTTSLNNGSNNFTVALPGGLVSSGFESMAFYGFDVTYYRELAAMSNYLDFTLEQGGSYTISNFSTDSARLFHLAADNSVVELINTTSPFVASSYQLNFSTAASGDNHHYYALTSFLTPTEVVLDSASDLQNITSGYEYLVIAGNGLLEGATELANYRHVTSGYSSLVVDVQDIYDEYNYGDVDPKAIRDFLHDAWAHWSTKPKFVFLVGDSNNDPLGMLNSANRNPPLPYFFDTTFYIAIPNDARFAYLSTSGPVPDIAIGRLPVTNNGQISDYLNKLTAYETAAETQPWTNKMTIINDNFNSPTETWEQPFIDLMNWVENPTNTPADYTINHLDLINQDSTTVKNGLTDDLNNELLFLLYMGHSATTGWAAEQLLTSSSVSNLNSVAAGVPLVASMTCLTGAFTTAGITSLSEALINANGKGAIGVLASSGLTEPLGQEQFAEALLARSYTQGKPIGLVLKDVRELLEVQGLDPDIAHSYNYLGDPALRIRFKAPLIENPDDPVSEEPTPTDNSSSTVDTESNGDSTANSDATTPNTISIPSCGLIVSRNQGDPIFSFGLLLASISILFFHRLFLNRRRN